MSKLLPCPFCGGEAFVRIDVALNPTQARYRVGCDKNPYCHGWYGHSRYYNTEAGAAAAWNTRHVETCSNKRGRCSACGSIMYDAPNYCAICGRKVEG